MKPTVMCLSLRIIPRKPLLRTRHSTPPAHPVCSSKSQLRANATRSAVSENQEQLSLSWLLDFTLSVSIVRDNDSSQIVCAGVVLDQIRQLAGVSDPKDQVQFHHLRQRTESRESRWTHSLPPKSASKSSFHKRVKKTSLN